MRLPTRHELVISAAVLALLIFTFSGIWSAVALFLIAVCSLEASRFLERQQSRELAAIEKDIEELKTSVSALNMKTGMRK